MNILYPSSNGNSSRLSQRSLPPLPPSSQRASVVLTDSPLVAPSEKYVDIPKWPKTAQGIRHGGFFTVFSCLGNVLTVVVACAFFAFGAFVLRHDRVPTSDVPHLGLLRDSARYGPTVFPIFLEAIVGQAVHALALWRLEHGERMKILDQLLGSTSIFATVVTQLKYRNIGLLGTLLLLLWSLSPIGGQASLRVLDFGVTTNMYPQSMKYLRMDSEYMPSEPSADGEMDGQTAIFTTEAVYGSSLLSPWDVKSSPLDTWGNVKIPMIERLSNLTKDSEGWQQVDNDNATTFSSLIGIPTTSLPSDRKASFNMETSYWVLDCPVLKLSNDSTTELPGMDSGGVTPLPDWQGKRAMNWGISSPLDQFNTTLVQPFPPTNTTGTPLRRMYYLSMEESDNIHYPFRGGNSYAECTMNTSYVEVRAACNGRNCTVTHMRPSTQEHIDPALINGLTGAYSNFFFTYFVEAIAGSSYKLTAVQRYFTNPASPFDNVHPSIALYQLDKEDFATKFAQLLNTFWLAGIGLAQIPGGMPESRAGLHSGTNTSTTTATVIQSTPVLVCNRGWLAALFVATGMMCLTGVLGLVLEFTRKTPDLAINISSLARDNPYIHLPPGGSALDSATRGRLMQNVRIRFGDVKSEEQVGHIAMASCEKAEEEVIGSGSPPEMRVARLKGGKERLYA